MAIFHLAAKVVSRKTGQSVVAKAAYNAREELAEERTGEVKDYSRAQGLIFSGIYTPANAPDWAHDRAKLWNAADQAERHPAATLAREYELALPHELTNEQRRFLVQDFVKESFTRKGYAVDVCIHAPDREGDERNYHAHILVSDRKLEAEGFAATKYDRQGKSTKRKAELEALREKWEHIANRHLERYGHEARIDHRSLKDQGIDREPTEHLGPYATQLERDGEESERGNANRDIEARNQELEEAQREYEAAQAEREQWEEKINQAAIQKADEEQKASHEQAKTDTKRQSRIKRRKRIETIRLYRGIGNNVGVAKEGEAVFFSTNRDRAAAFGVLHYVDVTRAEFEKLECPHSKRILDAEPIAKDDYRVDDPQILARLQRLKQRDSETRNQEREAAQREYEAAQAERETWEEKLAQAAIQKAEEDQKKEREAKRDEAKNGELGQSAADIRLAATLSPSGERFSAALKERCLVLSQISKQEAAALTDELGHHAPHYNAGELVIMNQFGGIHRLTERTTGKTRDELDKYLIQIKRENLPNAEQGKKEAVLLAQYKQRAELLAKQAQQKAELEKKQAERKEQREKQAREFEEKAKQEIDGAVSSKHYSDQFRLEKHLKENNIGIFGRAAARIKQFIGHKIDERRAEQHKEKLHKTIIENDWRNQDRDEARQARQDKSHERGQATVEIKQAERRDELGIQAPERDEALKDAQKTAQRTNTEKGFKELAEQTTSEVIGGLPSERAQERLAEWKNKPAKPKEREESPLEKTMGAVGKGREAAGQAARATDKGLRVIDKATGAIGGLSNGIGSILDGIAKPVEAFAEGLANMLGGASPAPRIHRREPDPTPDQIRDAEIAITNINRSIKRGDDIDAADLRNLPKETLEDIREGGDEYLMKMCQNWEIQQREREKEKERER